MEERQRELIGDVVATDRWVLDTAYGAWLDVVLPRVDLNVALDYPRWFSLQPGSRSDGGRAVVSLLSLCVRCNDAQAT
ncbi:MAG: hypothetical protein H0X12_11490 [Nocardioides sp.]|nr:hypothetical protein [Nocardioides sp.]